jgi:hypothetical protein
VIELRECARFANETLLEHRIGASVEREDFQRRDAVERSLPDLVDGPHSALPDELEDLELGKRCGKLGGLRRLAPGKPRRVGLKSAAAHRPDRHRPARQQVAARRTVDNGILRS